MPSTVKLTDLGSIQYLSCSASDRNSALLQCDIVALLQPRHLADPTQASSHRTKGLELQVFISLHLYGVRRIHREKPRPTASQFTGVIVDMISIA